MLGSLDAAVHNQYEQCDTASYISIGISSTLVYCYDLRPMYDTKNFLGTGGMERKKVRSTVSHGPGSRVYTTYVVKYKIW